MPACASTSDRGIFRSLLACALLLGLGSTTAFAANGRTDMPEEDDFTETPYTRYGEFNSDDEEEEDLKYFQYGRFFGVSLGVGYEGALENKGSLYQGGLPTIQLNVLYWFDWNFALAFGIMNSNHSYRGALDSRNDSGVVKSYDLNLFRFGVDLRYYFDTRDSPASVTFASPFILAGIASYTRTLQNAQTESDKDTEGALGYTFGAGLEFVLKPKKTYFNLEVKGHQVRFSETNSPVTLDSGTTLPNQAGLLYTVIGSFLFTW